MNHSEASSCCSMLYKRGCNPKSLCAFSFSALSSGYDGDAAEKGGSKADLYDRRRPGYDMAVIEELRDHVEILLDTLR